MPRRLQTTHETIDILRCAISAQADEVNAGALAALAPDLDSRLASLARTQAAGGPPSTGRRLRGARASSWPSGIPSISRLDFGS